MPVDDVIVRAGPVAVPLDYKVPTGTEIIPRSISARLNGSGAGGAYVPVLEVIAPNGAVTAYCARRVDIAAGASVLVSWFPGVAEADDVSSSTAGGGTVSNIVSPAATLAVSAPSGPTTSIDLAASGVAAGTYGDATHTAQVNVNAQGVVTAAAQVPISGIAGTGLVLIFDSTLGADAASIDTGAGGIPSGHGVLLVYAIMRTADAGATAAVNFTFNNDGAANYDAQLVQGVNAAVTAAAGAADTKLGFGLVHGSGGSASYATTLEMRIAGYDGTTFFKSGIVQYGTNDPTLANMSTNIWQVGYRSTAAISRLKMAPGSGANLKAGSRLIIYGTQ